MDVVGRSEIDSGLENALGVILGRPENAYSVEALARRAYMSRSSFAERFSARFGRTPMSLLREVRLIRGAGLLRGTTLPVQAVASRVGFASRSHFTRAFHAAFGITPSAYRAARGISM